LSCCWWKFFCQQVKCKESNWRRSSLELRVVNSQFFFFPCKYSAFHTPKNLEYNKQCLFLEKQKKKSEEV
jgi:hypothetical protein